MVRWLRAVVLNLSYTSELDGTVYEFHCQATHQISDLTIIRHETQASWLWFYFDVCLLVRLLLIVFIPEIKLKVSSSLSMLSTTELHHHTPPFNQLMSVGSLG